MKVISCNYRCLIKITLIIALFLCVVQVLRLELLYNDDMSNLDKLIRMSQTIKESKQQFYAENGIPACKMPELDITNPDIMKFLQNVPPLSCGLEDWVISDGTKLVITNKAKNKYGPITCVFSEIERVDDYNIRLMDPVESDDFHILKNSDFADVKCKSKDRSKWEGILAGVKYEPALKKESNDINTPQNLPKLNVLMFGFDSLSRNTVIRKLPKTYAYMKQKLNTLVLESYNIVGDGTPQALIPILTGKIELELPETRKRMNQANFVDIYPLIWKQYKQAGYITGFMEDVHHIGTFTYRLKGFKQQPTDHYMRTWYLAASPYFRYSRRFCMGGIPRHMVMLNYIKNIFNVHKNEPKFVFGFHGELSHDSYNDIGVADDDLVSWLQDLNYNGHLNNTILILMSDHGHRFADIRNTLQGKQEERLPFFSFTFPTWFKQIYPEAYANFLYNTQRLSTPFDIHKTLENILHLEQPQKENDHLQRAISLFDKIPLERTCADAFIEPHWCACLNWQEISISDTNVIEAAKYFVHFINSYTEEQRDICEILNIKEIIWAAKLVPTKSLLKFSKSGDLDGFVGDFSAKTKLTTEMYQLKVKLEPGDSLFEASITHDVVNNVFHAKISDVSRINKYGSQARCVENSIYRLRKYCYCKD